ncbi:hypothetical protein BTO07_13635 [Polaribacter sp. SA4-12]|nr:hypothetical protein BTO07_13635 [Polaribacter sp. SA4-12]
MFNNYKKLIKYLFLTPLLMAFQCDDELISTIEYNTYSIKITPKKTFSLNDTIWVEGRISAKAFDTAINDSIFNDNNQANSFYISKFITPTEHSNAKDAIDSFELIYEVGEFSFLGICENSKLFADAILDKDQLFYTYKLGLKPKFTGDFVISGLDGEIQNVERNLSISEAYPIDRHPKQIGFLNCEAVSWLYIEESTREFLFKVE